MKTKSIFRIFILSFFVFATSAAFANKTSVEVKTDKTAKKGSEVTITINVKHSANSGMHHTDWVTLKINGKEVKKWSYDKKNLPPSAEFTLTYTYTINEDTTIEAQGDCNLHGSTGSVTSKIAAE